MDNLDQLSSLLAPILNDPDAMAGITAAAEQLGLGGMLSGASKEKDSDDARTPPEAAGNPPVSSVSSALGGLLPALTKAGGSSETARLLAALRPFLHGERAKRLDEAEQIIKLLSIVSSLHEQGIF